jgi:hypothetical protein
LSNNPPSDAVMSDAGEDAAAAAQTSMDVEGISGNEMGAEDANRNGVGSPATCGNRTASGDENQEMGSEADADKSDDDPNEQGLSGVEEEMAEDDADEAAEKSEEMDESHEMEVDDEDDEDDEIQSDFDEEMCRELSSVDEDDEEMCSGGGDDDDDDEMYNESEEMSSELDEWDEHELDSDEDIEMGMDEMKYSGGKFHGFDPKTGSYWFEAPDHIERYSPSPIDWSRGYPYVDSTGAPDFLDSEHFVDAYKIKDEYSGPKGTATHRFSRFCDCTFCNEYRKHNLSRQLIKKPKKAVVPGRASELSFAEVFGKSTGFWFCARCQLRHDKYEDAQPGGEDSDANCSGGNGFDDAASDTSAHFDSNEGRLRPNRTMLYQATKNRKFLRNCDSDAEISDFSDDDLVNGGRVAKRHYYDRTKMITKHLRSQPGWYTDDEIPGRVFSQYISN